MTMVYGLLDRVAFLVNWFWLELNINSVIRRTWTDLSNRRLGMRRRLTRWCGPYAVTRILSSFM